MEVVSHPDLARLHPTGSHPERGERIALLLERFPKFLVAEPATIEALARCHARSYVERIRAIDAPTYLDADTICTATSFDAAVLACGVAIRAVERSAFAIVRPPGHHALPDRAMGFCLFNAAAVAARHAQAVLGIERVAIVDWDVHHGNGTQAVFWDDPSVLYASLHQWPFYPGTGGPDEQAETTLNVPLPAGSGDEDYAAAFRERVQPAVEAFAPDLVIVSAGFDAHEADPLALMEVTPTGFRDLAARSSALAPRVAAVLEGGYNLATLPDLVEAALLGFTDATNDRPSAGRPF